MLESAQVTVHVWNIAAMTCYTAAVDSAGLPWQLSLTFLKRPESRAAVTRTSYTSTTKWVWLCAKIKLVLFKRSKSSRRALEYAWR